MSSVYSNSDNLVNCSSKSTFSDQLNSVSLYLPDQYIFFIFGIIGCILNSSVLFLNIKYSMMRRHPGDMFGGQSLYFLILSFFSLLNGAGINNNSDLQCNFESIFLIFGTCVYFLQNILLYVYVVCAVRSVRAIKRLKSWHIHSIVVSVSLFPTIIFYSAGLTGHNLYGQCGVRATTSFPLFSMIILVFLVLSALATLQYLDYQLPKIYKYQLLLRFYRKYLYSQSILWSLLIFSEIIVYLNCTYIHAQQVNVFVTIANFARISQTVFLPIVRLYDPNIQLFFKILMKNKKQQPSEINQQTDKRTDENIFKNSSDSSKSIDVLSGTSKNLNENLVSFHNYNLDSTSIQNSPYNPPDLTPVYMKKNNNLNSNISSIELTAYSLKQRRTISNSSDQIEPLSSLPQAQSFILPEPIYLEDFEIDNLELQKNQSATAGAATYGQSPSRTTSLNKNIPSTHRHSMDGQTDGNYYESLSNSQRESVLYRVLSSVILSDKRKYKTFKIDIHNIRGNSIFEQSKIYTLDDKLILEQLSGIPKKYLELHSFSNIRMVAHCPLLFHSLIERDKINIELSLDLIANKNQIISAAQESNNPLKKRLSFYSHNPAAAPSIQQNNSKTNYSSNRSSQEAQPSSQSSNLTSLIDNGRLKNHKIDDYIFYSSDKQLILKTISKRQLKYLLSILPDYYSHIKQNPQSLITKIYGVFEFKGLETSDITFILMRNIAPTPSAFIKRRYDLKGSTHNRRVLSNYPNPDEVIPEEAEILYADLLLKDNDFMNLEGKIHVSRSDKEGLLQIIERDTLFLYRNGLINYSLMVIKVDWEAYLSTLNQNSKTHNDQGFSYQSLSNVRKSSFNSNNNNSNTSNLNAFVSSAIKSDTQPGIYYMFGVIDFLHKYTFSKRLARIAKAIKNMSTHINQSTTNPTLYSQRFLQLCRNIIDLPDCQSPRTPDTPDKAEK